MKPFTTHDILAGLPGHARARLARHIDAIGTPEARVVYREALEASAKLAARDQQREERNRLMFNQEARR